AELISERPEYRFDADRLFAEATKFATILHGGIGDVNSPHENSSSRIDFGATVQASFNGSIELLVRALTRLEGEGYALIVTSDTPSEQRRLEELIGETVARLRDDLSGLAAGPNAGDRLRLNGLSAQSLHGGFIFPSPRIAVFTEHEIFGRLKRRGLG